MSLVKKLKDILFEEEEDFTEPVKTKEEKHEEPVKIEPVKEEKNEVNEEIKSVPNSSEREVFRNEKSFQFPDFDEDEFVNSISKPKPTVNVLEYEKKKTIEKRTDYGRYEKVETKEIIEKKKFKPSPIISPVYGILNQDYKAEDIVNKGEVPSSISIEEVRKKAFEPEAKPIIDEPVVTFFEEKDSSITPDKDAFKSIDDLLDDSSNEIELEDTLEMPKASNMSAIEDELDKLDDDVEKNEDNKIEDTLDSDLFELIDSMYDERKED